MRKKSQQITENQEYEYIKVCSIKKEKDSSQKIVCNTGCLILFHLIPQTFDIPCRHTFSTVKPLSRYNVVQVSAGKTHSGIIDCKYWS